MTATKREALDLAREARSAKAAATHEEILWFMSYGWSKQRVAARLGITVDAVEKHLRQEQAS